MSNLNAGALPLEVRRKTHVRKRSEFPRSVAYIASRRSRGFASCSGVPGGVRIDALGSVTETSEADVSGRADDVPGRDVATSPPSAASASLVCAAPPSGFSTKGAGAAVAAVHTVDASALLSSASTTRFFSTSSGSAAGGLRRRTGRLRFGRSSLTGTEGGSGRKMVVRLSAGTATRAAGDARTVFRA